MSRSDGALMLLWRLKVAGRARLLIRRGRTPAGALTVLAGFALLALWVLSIALRSSSMERTGEPPTADVARLGLAIYLAFVTFSSLSFRGVYVPRPELERLFAGPVARPALVRYRMLGSITMSLPFVALMGLLLAPRFASPAASMAAIALIIPTSTVVGQGLSLLAARTGGALSRLLDRVPPALLRLLGAVGIMGILGGLVFGPGMVEREGAARSRALEEFIEARRRDQLPHRLPESDPRAAVASLGERLEAVAAHPVTRVVTAPLEPWARALVAPSGRAALPWLAAILVALGLLFEGVARLPVDFRERSLRTSLELERRLARARKGRGGVGAFGHGGSARGVPWLLGRGPAGAVVWLRTAWILRQARGTLVVAAVVGVGGVLLGTRVLGDSLPETVALALLGVVYLSSGLRADFRGDLDRMEVLKAWPLSPWRLFAATLLPATALTSSVVWAVLAVRAGVQDAWGAELLLVALAVPPAAFAWTAVDNAVFLLFPVRYVPGQGSAIQHAGRGFLLVLLRALLFGVLLLAALGGAWAILELAGAGTVPAAAAVLWVLGVGALGLAAVVSFGAWALRRFDVSRLPPAG